MKGLTDKVIVVAGGGTGIGAASAERLGEEGAKVVVGDLNLDRAKETAARIVEKGGDAIALQFDIADDASVGALIDGAVAAYGKINGVHINAADLSPQTLGRDTDAVAVDLDVWDRTMNINLRGHLLVTRHAVPQLLKQGGGSLVYTTSGAAYEGEPERPAYAVSKSAINALVRHVAGRWGKEGIRANAVAPGFVLSSTAQSLMNEEQIAAYLASNRSTRLGRPEDVAAMATLLLSDDGEWINGQVININGGAALK